MTGQARELRSLGQDLTKAGWHAQRKARDAVAKTAADITADAKAVVAVDTGNLKNSIGYDILNVSGDAGAEIGPTAEYGIYIEEGTSVTPPRPFMGYAFDRRVPGFEKIIAQLATEVI